MLVQEFLKTIKPLLRLYGCCADQENIKTWYESVKNYPVNTIEDATRAWIQKSPYTPTPYNIIDCIPKAKPIERLVPKIEEVEENGKIKKIRVVHCQRCNDTGLITRTDKDGNVYGKPCDCVSGHGNYTWGWLTQEEQQDYVNKNGYHGEVIGESWKEAS